MKNRNIIVGLDVGTTKICVIAGEVEEDRADILAIGTSPSRGLRKGVVVDIESTVDSIRKAVKEAEIAGGIEIDEAYVGIAGGHIKGFESYGAVGVKGKEVRVQDVERAIDAASAVYVPLDREVLHVIPTEFILDGQNGIKVPVGMSGVRLEVKVHIITGAVSSVQNLIRCCENAGLKVIDIVLEPIASAEAVLTKEEKELGVAIVDIGGGTTDIAVYKDGSLKHTAVIALGGNHFTNDIAIGLRVPVQEAERIKKKHGYAVAGVIDLTEEIDVMGADRQLRKIPRRYLAEIIQPRCEEISELIKQEIEGFPNFEPCVSGVVLTGGSALLDGIDRLMESKLQLPVRIGMPEGMMVTNTSALRCNVNNPMYSTGVGLMLYGSKEGCEKAFYEDMFDGIFDRMSGWVKNLFGINNQDITPRRISIKQKI